MDLVIQNQTQLHEFQERLTNDPCYKCPLYGEISPGGYHPIAGRGMGRIMVVGMSPTVADHISGKILQGPVGKQIRQEFRGQIGLNFDQDCYHTTLMRCHPDSIKETYKVTHRKKCSIHLAKEIRLVDPLFIVVFGRETFQSIGYMEDYPGYGVPFKTEVFGVQRWVLVTNNPSSIMRSTAQLKAFQAQLRGVAKWLDSELDYYAKNGMKIPVKMDKYSFRNILVNTPEKARDMLRDMTSHLKSQPNPIIAIDTETTGLDLYTPDFKIIGASFAVTENIGYYVPVGHRPKPRELFPKPIKQLSIDELRKIFDYIINRRKWNPIFHNFYYDYRVIKQLGIDVGTFDLKNNRQFHDSMILAYLQDENDNVGLKDQTFMRFNIKPKKFKDVAEGAAFQYVPLDKAADYAGDDATGTLRLFNHVLKDVEYISEHRTDGKLLNRIYPGELLASRIMADAQDKGIMVDTEYLELVKKRLDREERQLFNKLDSICNVIDHSSTYQLMKLIDKLVEDKSDRDKGIIEEARERFELEFGLAADEDHLKQLKGFIRTESDKGGTFRWDADTLDTYIDTLFKYRKVNKIRSTYVESILDKVVIDDQDLPIIHGSFRTLGTTSGRMSSNQPNLQNLPRMATDAPKFCSLCGHNSEMDESGEKVITPWYSKVDPTGAIYTCSVCGKSHTTYMVDIRRAFKARPGKVFVLCDWN